MKKLISCIFVDVHISSDGSISIVCQFYPIIPYISHTYKSLLSGIFQVLVDVISLRFAWYLFCFMSKFYIVSNHNDVIKWKHFPRYWLFVRGIRRSTNLPLEVTTPCIVAVLYGVLGYIGPYYNGSRLQKLTNGRCRRINDTREVFPRTMDSPHKGSLMRKQSVDSGCGIDPCYSI